ncbi:MAG: hypothetical protein IPM30_00725 [Burkholderiales bacterium]|jgi:hypothetical protein|nr:hypothetical protein [Burkholderiales bacterium]
MRSRPIGPGIGGLYYSPLLRDVHSTAETAACQSQAANSSQQHRPALSWQAIRGLARRAAGRFVEARMAQAQAYVDRAQRDLQIDRPAARPGTAARYY